MSDPLLRLEQVSKHFAAPDNGPDIPVLNGIDLVVHGGEAIAVVGPSGCGKTTLLSLMGGLDVPSGGRIVFEDRDISGLGERERSVFRRDGVGFIFQRHHLLPQCTAWENVLLPTLGFPASVRRRAGSAQRAARLLERMGLAGRARHRPGELSGGECLRLAVARALINSPRLLLADEPTGSLDERSADALADLLVEVNREEGTALVVVTHSARLAERMERRFLLHGGRLRA